MKILRRIAISISMYSRIPMPHFEWNEDDMEHSLSFFPLTGLFIGFAVYGAFALTCMLGLPQIACCIILILIPYVITGGFHTDGYMDTEDALRSYRSKERKLEILKDPHTGSFAVTGLLAWTLAALAATAVIIETPDMKVMVIYSCSFVVGRSLSGLTSMLCKKAREDGMLAAETTGKHRSVLTALIMWLIAAALVMYMTDILAATAVLAVYGIFMLYYIHMTGKQFGGVTGDTAGYFIVVGEACAMLALAAHSILVRI